MTHSPSRIVARRAQGFSLIEMMIAMTIGLVVTAAIGYIFMASSRNMNYSQGISRVQENSRSSLIILNTLIRQAGYLYAPMTYLDPAEVFVSTTPAVSGGTGSVTSAFSWITGSTLTLQSNSEYLEIAFVGDHSSVSATDGRMTDCVGRAALNYDVHVNVFFVATRTGESVPSLYCATQPYLIGTANVDSTSYSAPVAVQPLISGVNAMTVTYGIDSDGDQYANYYSAASAMTSSDWTKVRSIQLSLTVQSTDVVDNQTYQACVTNASTGKTSKNSAGDTTLNCGYMQRPLYQTIVLRNRLIK